jgi:hypothetical protein
MRLGRFWRLLRLDRPDREERVVPPPGERRPAVEARPDDELDGCALDFTLEEDLTRDDELVLLLERDD